jgi:hypothetical protein
MNDQTYNGWTNRETWLVNIHFEPTNKADLDNAKEFLEEQAENLLPFFRDFVDLSLINWEELASYLDDAETEGDA